MTMVPSIPRLLKALLLSRALTLLLASFCLAVLSCDGEFLPLLPSVPKRRISVARQPINEALSVRPRW